MGQQEGMGWEGKLCYIYYYYYSSILELASMSHDLASMSHDLLFSSYSFSFSHAQICSLPSLSLHEHALLENPESETRWYFKYFLGKCKRMT